MTIYKLKITLVTNDPRRPSYSMSWYFESEELAYEFLCRRYPRILKSGTMNGRPTAMGWQDTYTDSRTGERRSLKIRFRINRLSVMGSKELENYFTAIGSKDQKNNYE